MVILGGTQSTQFPIAESTDCQVNIFLIDLITKDVLNKAFVKPFRMFSACCKGAKDCIYMIGGIDTATNKWTSSAFYFDSVSLQL